MLRVDFIGLLATIFLVGLRYPHYVIGAACIHEVGRLLMTVFLELHVNSLVAAGAFGSMSVNNAPIEAISILVIFSGPFANYLMSSMIGGISFEPTKAVLNSLAHLKSPFAVINFRLAILSLFIQVWKNVI